jgi:hypothetical protein
MDLAQAFFLLQSLKENMPHTSDIAKKWVDDYHSILDTVEKETGTNLSPFRVPETDFQRQVVSARRGSFRGGPGHVQYGDNVVVSHARLAHKVDAVLSYFRYSQGTGNTPKQSIGFKAGV